MTSVVNSLQKIINDFVYFCWYYTDELEPASSALAFDALNDGSSNMTAVRLTEPRREKVQIASFLKNQSANFVNDRALWDISFFTAPIDAKVVPSISVIGS
ncbi:MAG: hypothetical protein C5S47_08130 [Candidatus Methanogasteraceae archaeon]|nr:MAG: hypothetical protein C5S47_08130 [ANME-2 cluster archaeon]